MKLNRNKYFITWTILDGLLLLWHTQNWVKAVWLDKPVFWPTFFMALMLVNAWILWRDFKRHQEFKNDIYVMMLIEKEKENYERDRQIQSKT